MAYMSQPPSPSSVRGTRLSISDICEALYGDGRPESLDAILPMIYEPNAECVNRYENPLVTATSRSMIADIMRMSWSWCEVDVHKPTSILASLLPWHGGLSKKNHTWFRALRTWHELGNVCETEGFDGTRKSLVEHTIHILFFPDVHSGRVGPLRHTASQSSLDVSPFNLVYSIPHFQWTSEPSLAMLGTKLSWPSPLHFELRILTRLEFNGERILHHRDFWDVKDLVALVPGAKLGQYIGTRLTGRALATMGHLRAWLRGGGTVDEREENCSPDTNSLGLIGMGLHEHVEEG